MKDGLPVARLPMSGRKEVVYQANRSVEPASHYV